jgi:hypothetical protein
MESINMQMNWGTFRKDRILYREGFRSSPHNSNVIPAEKAATRLSLKCKGGFPKPGPYEIP